MNKFGNHQRESSPSSPGKDAASFPKVGSPDIPMSPSSISSNLAPSPQGETKECHICGVKIGTLSKKRHHCAHCGLAVCEAHSLKKREFPATGKLQRICDKCDEDMIKEEIRQEMQAQIDDLDIEIRKTSDENDRRARENRDKTAILNNLEHEISKAEKMHKQKEQTLMERLGEEQQKSEKARTAIEKLQRDLEESHNSEKVMAERCHDVDKQIEELRTEAERLRDRKEDLTKHLQDLEAKIKSSVPLSQLKQVACPNCRSRLDNMYKPRKSGTTLPEEHDTSLSFLPTSAAKSKPPVNTQKSCKDDCQLM